MFGNTRRSMLMAGLAVPVILLAPTAMAQVGTDGTITDNNAVFHLGAYLGDATGSGPTSSFVVDGDPSHNNLFQTWWWTRVDNDTRELAVNNATAVSFPSPSQMRLTYNMGTYSLTMEYAVSGLGNGFGVLTQTMTIQNNTNSTLDVTLLNFNDIDVKGTSNDDSAVATGPATVRFTDGVDADWRATYEAAGDHSFRESPASSLLGSLTNTTVDSFDQGVMTPGPGDLGIVSQSQFTLDAGGTQTVSVTLTVVPAPAAAAVLGLGGLAATRRRRA